MDNLNDQVVGEKKQPGSPVIDEQDDEDDEYGSSSHSHSSSLRAPSLGEDQERQDAFIDSLKHNLEVTTKKAAASDVSSDRPIDSDKASLLCADFFLSRHLPLPVD